ncbi:MAG: hypothetical protein PHU67_00115 [Sulfurovum sp.]|nr:hypothetical protein [Sulfurovum sp.]MDD3500612.1 hypothetical protein [Sulfurovum sp.]
MRKNPFDVVGEIVSKDFKARVSFGEILHKVYLGVVCYYTGSLDGTEEK